LFTVKAAFLKCWAIFQDNEHSACGATHNIKLIGKDEWPPNSQL